MCCLPDLQERAEYLFPGGATGQEGPEGGVAPLAMLGSSDPMIQPVI